MRCYFHLVSHHDTLLDDTGVEVTDIEMAEVEALIAIQELRQEDSDAGETWKGWQLNITDESGRILSSIPLDTPSQ